VQLLTADGVTIAAALYQAAGDAPAVVLVHMFTRTKEDWRPFAERLQAAGLTALAIDLRGHGASGGVSTPAPAMALDVQAAIGFLAGRSGGRGIAIVGASLGASAASWRPPIARGARVALPLAGVRLPRRPYRRRAAAAGGRCSGRQHRDPLAARVPDSWAARRRLPPEQRLSLVAHAPRSSTVTPAWPRRGLAETDGI
jgi:predicted alpha/beta hydrolase